MPNKKIITTLILCVGGIFSAWLIQRTPANTLKTTYSDSSISTYSYEENNNGTSTEWKKLLASVDSKNTEYEDLTSKNSDDSVFDDTTLTAQMSRDFMSQYLLLKKGGKSITKEDIEKITSSVMSNPVYNEIKAPAYLPKNLHISNNNKIENLRKYKNTINLILKNRSSQIQTGPMDALNSSIKSGGSTTVEDMEILTKIGSAFIKDFLDTEVPSSAVAVHLNLMNAVSGIVVTTEALKANESDPARAMIGLSQYSYYINNFQKRLSEMNTYLSKIK